MSLVYYFYFAVPTAALLQPDSWSVTAYMLKHMSYLVFKSRLSLSITLMSRNLLILYCIHECSLLANNELLSANVHNKLLLQFVNCNCGVQGNHQPSTFLNQFGIVHYRTMYTLYTYYLETNQMYMFLSHSVAPAFVMYQLTKVFR